MVHLTQSKVETYVAQVILRYMYMPAFNYQLEHIHIKLHKVLKIVSCMHDIDFSSLIAKLMIISQLVLSSVQILC